MSISKITPIQLKKHKQLVYVWLVRKVKERLHIDMFAIFFFAIIQQFEPLIIIRKFSISQRA